MSDKWMSINKFMQSINSLMNETTAYVNVYFDDYKKSKFNYSIKPISFSFITEAKKVIKVSYYDIHKIIPEMQYLNLPGSKNKEMEKLELTKRLRKIVIEVKESVYNNIKYHKLYIKEVDQKYYKGMIKDYEDARIKYTNELAKAAMDNENENEDEIDDFEFLGLD